jgi:hypothetical protein
MPCSRSSSRLCVMKASSYGFQCRFELLQFQVEVRVAVAAEAICDITGSNIIQIQIIASDPMFVEVDAVHASHVHKAYASRPPNRASNGSQLASMRLLTFSRLRCCWLGIRLQIHLVQFAFELH